MRETRLFVPNEIDRLLTHNVPHYSHEEDCEGISQIVMVLDVEVHKLADQLLSSCLGESNGSVLHEVAYQGQSGTLVLLLRFDPLSQESILIEPLDDDRICIWRFMIISLLTHIMIPVDPTILCTASRNFPYDLPRDA